MNRFFQRLFHYNKQGQDVLVTKHLLDWQLFGTIQSFSYSLLHICKFVDVFMEKRGSPYLRNRLIHQSAVTVNPLRISKSFSPSAGISIVGRPQVPHPALAEKVSDVVDDCKDTHNIIIRAVSFYFNSEEND